jgi:beta-glucanase (GH16 family)
MLHSPRTATTLFLLAIALATAGALADEPATKPTPESSFVPAGYVKVFSDEMNAPALDTSKWWTRYIYEKGLLDTLNDERQRYRENDNHVMTGSTLELTARKVPGDEPRFQYESGLIRSKQTFKFGYFEARLKLPKGQGTWPCFWLNPDSNAEGKTGWPPEIDIMEVALNMKDDTASMNHVAVHGNSKKGQPDPWERKLLKADENFKKNYCHVPFDMTDDYHVYAAKWSDNDTVEFFIDGKSYALYHYKWVHGNGKEAPNAHVLLNLAVGGNWAGRYGIDDTAFPQSFSVDYVRIYQKKGQQRTGQSTIGQDLLNVPTTQPATQPTTQP